MTQEEKELLLRDLCARLPYGVKILHEGWNWEWDDELSTVERVVGIDDKFVYTKVINTHNGKEYRDDKHTIRLFDDKIFLRPMSSMTEEEEEEYEEVVRGSFEKQLEFYLRNHLDFRGLIPKGLALEALDGMYNK